MDQIGEKIVAEEHAVTCLDCSFSPAWTSTLLWPFSTEILETGPLFRNTESGSKPIWNEDHLGQTQDLGGSETISNVGSDTGCGKQGGSIGEFTYIVVNVMASKATLRPNGRQQLLQSWRLEPEMESWSQNPYVHSFRTICAPFWG